MNIQLIKDYFKKFKEINGKNVYKFLKLYPDIQNEINIILKNTNLFQTPIEYITYLVLDIKLPKCQYCGKTLTYHQMKCHRILCSNKCSINSNKEKFKNLNFKERNIKSEQAQLKKYGARKIEFVRFYQKMLTWSDYIIPLFSLSDYNGKSKIYKWKCTKCGNIFENHIFKNRHVDGLNFQYLPRCLHCYPKNNSLWSSKEEKEFINFCKQYYPNLIHNSKKIIYPYELDIYIPELKLAIEFNGIYYHSIMKKPAGFHLMKTTMCEKLDIRLIHIWEDEWLNNQDQIKQKLINIFQNTEQIDISKKLDRCWFMLKEIPGYNINIEKPEIIKRNNYLCENCSYFYYIKQN